MSFITSLFTVYIPGSYLELPGVTWTYLELPAAARSVQTIRMFGINNKKVLVLVLVSLREFELPAAVGSSGYSPHSRPAELQHR